MAVVALICGIIGLAFLPVSIIISPVALVTGIRAKKRIAASGGSLEGTGIAQAGYVLGMIGTVIAGLLILAFGICLVVFATSGSMY